MVLVALAVPTHPGLPASQLGDRGVPGVPQGGQMQVLHGVSEKEARVQSDNDMIFRNERSEWRSISSYRGMRAICAV